MTTQKLSVALKRAYDEPATSDGTRVLVERLWPRGISKERAHIDLWLKEVAPSTELRKWFNHDPQKFSEFRRRYETSRLSPSIASLACLFRFGANRLISKKDDRVRHL